MLFLDSESFGYSLWLLVRTFWHYALLSTYIVERGHFCKSDVLGSTNKWFLSSGKDTAFEMRGTLVAVDQDVSFAEVWFAAGIKVFFGLI